MPGNIDQRIVEMRFDNSQFESGVKQSVGTLNNLKQSLDFSGFNSKGFKIAKALDITGSLAGIEKTATAMDKFKARAAQAAQFAGKAMLTFGKVSVGAVTGITTALGGMALKGGITRAMNLKQANFMLKNLLAKEKDAGKATQAIMDNVSKSVDGTAYSLDQAAMVAAQFAATGMRGGKDMQNALNGLAGAAATFNADYSRMGLIFTQIAATGHVYSNDLLQLSTMGMNARATLVDFYKTVRGESDMTVKKLDDMVRKGEVDFNTFAQAMGWAFGDSATKANDTFQGALSNVKSALSRIGEHVADPAIDGLRDFFNTVRPIINEINHLATPSLDKFGGTIKKVSAYFSELGLAGKASWTDVMSFDKWNKSNSFTIIRDYLKSVASGSIMASESITEFAKNVDKKGKITEQRVEHLVKKGKISFEIWKNALDKALGEDDKHDQSTLAIALRGVVNVLAELSKITSSVGDSFRDVFDIIPTDVIRQAVVEFYNMTKEFHISDEVLGNVKSAFTGVLTIVRDFFLLLKTAGKVLSPFISGFLTLASVALTIAARMADVVVAISDFISNSTLFKAAVKGLTTLFQIFMTIFAGFGGIVEDVINSLGGGALSKRMSQLSAVTNLVAGGFKNLKGTLIDNFPMFKGVINKMTAGFQSFGEGIKEAFKGVDIGSFKELFSYAGIMAVIKGVTGLFKQAASSFSGITGVFDNVAKTLQTLENVLSTYQKNLDAAALLTIAKAVAILAGSIIALSLVDPKRLVPALIAIEILLHSLDKMMTSLTQMTEKADFRGIAKLYVLGGALKDIAIAVAILAGSVIALSRLSLQELATGLFGMATACLILIKVTENLTSMKGEIVKGATGLIFFATAIRILASAVTALSSLSPEELFNGLGSVLILLASIAMVVNNMDKKGAAAIAKAGISFMALAGSIFIMAQACKALGSMDPYELALGLSAVLVMLVALSEFSVKAQSGLKTTTAVAQLLLLAGAMFVMVQAVKMLGKLSLEKIGHGILALAGSLGVLIAALGVMSTMPNTTKSSMAISSLCVSLLGLAAVMKIIGSMDVEELKSALLGLAVGLGTMVMALGALSTGGIGVELAAGALLVLSVALLALAPALKTLSTIPIPGVAAALLAVAGAIGIFAAAAFVLGPVMVPMAALAGIITLLGIACMAAGTGIMLFAAGIAALALTSAKSIKNIAKVIEELSTVIPAIFQAIGQGFLALFEVLATNAAKFAEIGVVLILALLNTIKDHIQEFVTVGLLIIANFMYGLAEGLPTLVDAGIQLTVAFFNSLAEGIRANQGIILEAIGNLVSAILEFVISAFQAVLGEIPGVGEKISSGLESAKKAIHEKLAPKEGEKSGKEYAKGISQGVGKNTDKSKKAGEKHAKAAGEGASKTAPVKKAGEKAGSAYEKALAKAAEKSGDVGKKLPEKLASAADKTDKIKKSGEKGGGDYAKGVDKKQGEASKAGKNLANKNKDGMSNVKGFDGLGNNAASGFVRGANSHGSEAWNAGWRLASSYYDAIKAKLQEHSPSKATYKLAKFAVLGFVKPAKDYAGMVKRSGEAIANSLMTGMRSASAAEYIDAIPNQPVIRPVVDLSGVHSAAKDVDSLFIGSRQIKATARIGGKINRGSSVVGMDNLISKVDKLGTRQVMPSTNTFNIRVDGSENPEAFAHRLVRQLEIEMRTI